MTELLEKNSNPDTSIWEQKIVDMATWPDDRLECALVVNEISLIEWCFAHSLKYDRPGVAHATEKLFARLKHDSRAKGVL